MPKFPDEQVDKLIRYICTQKYSAFDIAKYFGCSRVTVARYAKHLGRTLPFTSLEEIDEGKRKARKIRHSKAVAELEKQFKNPLYKASVKTGKVLIDRYDEVVQGSGCVKREACFDG